MLTHRGCATRSRFALFLRHPVSGLKYELSGGDGLGGAALISGKRSTFSGRMLVQERWPVRYRPCIVMVFTQRTIYKEAKVVPRNSSADVHDM
ncbi:hypothetical protein PM082_021155 [Marasmius tenuissimus]|nr:hypothetical protein PM082_021155 [Marasmius tenuissimus]